MYKLQFKLIFYNALTKGFIILILGCFVMIFLDDISYSQLDVRLQDKADRLIKNITDNEVYNKISENKSFTDYNVLKEEYVFLDKIESDTTVVVNPNFITSPKTVGNDTESFRIINYYFNHKGELYHLEIGQSLVAVKRLRKTILLITIFAVLVSLGISLIIDILFNKVLLNPFYKIVDQKINKVNDPLSYNHQLIKTTTQDFRALDESISGLMNKVSNFILKEKQFIANVSHELLTPISILSVRFENILNDENLNELQTKKIFDSIKTLQRLKGVVNSLLLISKIENHQFNKPDIISIESIISEVIYELQDRAENKNISIFNEIRYQFKSYANESLVHTLFFNIINNAIKYNNEDGKIIVKDKTSNEYYNIYIVDTGKGMEKDAIEHAFNRFEKVEDDEEVLESHGLGLAIVKSIAQFHKIDLEIKSDLGIGTTFILRFPNQFIF
nr:HAMP domain-containing histidine kinase [Pseudopedobacter sp.]